MLAFTEGIEAIMAVHKSTQQENSSYKERIIALEKDISKLQESNLGFRTLNVKLVSDLKQMKNEFDLYRRHCQNCDILLYEKRKLQDTCEALSKNLSDVRSQRATEQAQWRMQKADACRERDKLTAGTTQLLKALYNCRNLADSITKQTVPEAMINAMDDANATTLERGTPLKHAFPYRVQPVAQLAREPVSAVSRVLGPNTLTAGAIAAKSALHESRRFQRSTANPQTGQMSVLGNQGELSSATLAQSKAAVQGPSGQPTVSDSSDDEPLINLVRLPAKRKVVGSSSINAPKSFQKRPRGLQRSRPIGTTH